MNLLGDIQEGGNLVKQDHVSLLYLRSDRDGCGRNVRRARTERTLAGRDEQRNCDQDCDVGKVVRVFYRKLMCLCFRKGMLSEQS